MSSSDERLLARRDEVAVVDSGDRVAILDLRKLERPPMVLEGTAAAVWQLLDGTRTETEVVSALDEVFDDVPREVIAEGVTSFLGELEALGLLGEIPQAHDEPEREASP